MHKLLEGRRIVRALASVAVAASLAGCADAPTAASMREVPGKISRGFYDSPAFIQLGGPVPSKGVCAVNGIVNDGTPPYTFYWTLDGAPITNGEQYWNHAYGRTGSTTTIGLTVYDAYGYHGTWSETVTVGGTGFSCLRDEDEGTPTY